MHVKEGPVVLSSSFERDRPGQVRQSAITWISIEKGSHHRSVQAVEGEVKVVREELETANGTYTTTVS